MKDWNIYEVSKVDEFINYVGRGRAIAYGETAIDANDHVAKLANSFTMWNYYHDGTVPSKILDRLKNNLHKD